MTYSSPKAYEMPEKLITVEDNTGMENAKIMLILVLRDFTQS